MAALWQASAPAGLLPAPKRVEWLLEALPATEVATEPAPSLAPVRLSALPQVRIQLSQGPSAVEIALFVLVAAAAGAFIYAAVQAACTSKKLPPGPSEE